MHQSPGLWDLALATWIVAAFATPASATVESSPPPEPAEPGDYAPAGFAYGDSCDDLIGASFFEMSGILAPLATTYQETFCALPPDRECIEYTALVQPFGVIVTSAERGFCRFAPYLPPSDSVLPGQNRLGRRSDIR